MTLSQRQGRGPNEKERNPMDLVSLKQRFGVIGNSELLNRALEVAVRVAPTDLSVLVTGESGVGKEFFPQIIHAYSAAGRGTIKRLSLLKIISFSWYSAMTIVQSVLVNSFIFFLSFMESFCSVT